MTAFNFKARFSATWQLSSLLLSSSRLVAVATHTRAEGLWAAPFGWERPFGFRERLLNVDLFPRRDGGDEEVS